MKNPIFQAFYEYDNGKFVHIPEEFLHWLIGFTEGDDCFVITTRKNGQKEQSFVITQATYDIQILHYIRDTLGFGSVIAQGKTTHRFVLQKLADIYKILLILNGNICLPTRQKQFSIFQREYNKKAEKQKNHVKKRQLCPYLALLPFINKPSKHHAWISGFFDAEGCFSVSFQHGGPTFRIRRVCAQKGDANLPVQSSLILEFGTGAIEKHSKPNTYSFVVSGSKNCFLIYDYFHAFPLRTLKKQKAFQLWKEVHRDIVNQKHLDNEYRLNMVEKAKEINNFQKKMID